jgi:hypothetical protein
MKKLYLILVLLTFTQTCLAVENSRVDEKFHTIGFNLGVGTIRTDVSSESDDLAGVAGINYGYQYDSTWAIGTGLVSGDSICIITCLDDMSLARNVGYDSYILNIKGSLPLSNRWFLFGKVGGNYYNVEYTGSNRANLKDSGVGALLAAGFDFRAHNGFGLGLETTWLDMGDIYATTFTLNISYAF